MWYYVNEFEGSLINESEYLVGLNSVPVGVYIKINILTCDNYFDLLTP